MLSQGGVYNMGLFSRKKRFSEEDLEVPSAPGEEELDMPEFPELPEEELDMPEEPEMPEVIEKPVELEEHEIPSKPLFIDINDFKEILEELGMMKTILKEADDAGSRTEEFAIDEDNDLRRWKNLVYDIQKKLIYCEKTLFR